jgi:hypothetical protein
MLYSHSIEESRFSSFALFLSYLVDGVDKYKGAVDKVLQDAHDLATGRKNIYNVDRTNYPITVYLKNSDPEFFKRLDTTKIKKSDYKKILSFIEKQGTLDFA